MTLQPHDIGNILAAVAVILTVYKFYRKTELVVRDGITKKFDDLTKVQVAQGRDIAHLLEDTSEIRKNMRTICNPLEKRIDGLACQQPGVKVCREKRT